MCYSSGYLISVFRKEHEKCTFEVHEVYAVDILISSGEGKVRINSLVDYS